MGREISFRAKHIHVLPGNEHLDGRWIEGYLSDECHINSPELEGEFLIDPETVCQYTGVLDRNGQKIFKGDIVKRELFGESIVGQVVWFDIGFCGFYLKHKSDYYHMGKIEHTGKSDDEVIGNIFDSPELLEGE